MKPFRRPGTCWRASRAFSQIIAEVFIAETGGDMTQFPTAGHLASWAGSARAPTNPPAGSSPPRPDPGTVTSRASSASPRCQPGPIPETYFSAKYRRVAPGGAR